MAFSVQRGSFSWLATNPSAQKHILTCNEWCVLIYSTITDQKPTTGTLVNREDPDEMPLHVPFHQGLHCLINKNRSSEKDVQYLFRNHNQ